MEKRRIKKRLTGVVVSNRMDKTVIVAVDRLVKHPVYKKYIHRRSKFKAHDEGNTGQVGDRVEIVHSRPISKTKHWRLSRIVSHQA